MKSKKLRESARYKPCQVRIPNVCNHYQDTTVLAHVGKGGGMGRKCPDLFATFACSDCHDAIDGRAKTIYSKDQLDLWALEGMVRTQEIWLKEGLINVV